MLHCLSRKSALFPKPAHSRGFGCAARFALGLAFALCLVVAPYASAAPASSPNVTATEMLVAENENPFGTNNREQERPATQENTGQGLSNGTQSAMSPMEAMFNGSFVGALLFGFPFTGPGLPDVLSLAVLVLIFLKFTKGGPSRPSRPGDDTWNESSRRDEGGREHPRDTSQNADDAPRRRTGERKPESTEESFWDAWSRNKTSPPRNDRERPSPTDRQDDAGENPRSQNGRPPQNNMEWRAKTTWDSLRSKTPEPQRQNGASGSGDFDKEDFLKGARALYVRLQNSWAARDVDDLIPFVTPGMLRILREQATLDPAPRQVQVLLVTAAFSGITREQGAERASVTFDVVMHEGPENDTTEPVNIHELWHFVRGLGAGGTWRLDGIEQV